MIESVAVKETPTGVALPLDAQPLAASTGRPLGADPSLGGI